VNGMANGAQVLSKQRIIPAVKVHHLKNLKSSEAVILTLELIYSICISFLKT
jgi:phosphoribosylformylglycinamidine (FGAM) synthase-like amidotransferase family enzyme